jgi:hypothetical protein
MWRGSLHGTIRDPPSRLGGDPMPPPRRVGTARSIAPWRGMNGNAETHLAGRTLRGGPLGNRSCSVRPGAHPNPSRSMGRAGEAVKGAGLGQGGGAAGEGMSGTTMRGVTRQTQTRSGRRGVGRHQASGEGDGHVRRVTPVAGAAEVAGAAGATGRADPPAIVPPGGEPQGGAGGARDLTRTKTGNRPTGAHVPAPPV